MRLPFAGNYPINQTFNDACCRASYAKFGLNGHNGIDYGLPTGTPVLAAISGKVFVGVDPNGFGNYVTVTGEYQTIYAHLQKATVSSGQQVSEGQQIGVSNNTGNSSGPHLHFGVKPLNPDNNNGFLGSIDPQPLLNEGVEMTQQEAYAVVSQVYRVATDIDPEPGQADYWAKRIQANPAAVAELASALGGADYKGDKEFRYKGRHYSEDMTTAKKQAYDEGYKAAGGSATTLKPGTYKVN